MNINQSKTAEISIKLSLFLPQMNTDHYELEYLHTETGKLTDAGETVVLQSYFSAFILPQMYCI